MKLRLARTPTATVQPNSAGRIVVTFGDLGLRLVLTDAEALELADQLVDATEKMKENIT